MGRDIWSANYQQEPIDLKGRLYSSFKTYSGALPAFKQIRAYIDTADEGSDYLCCIVYGITFQTEAYVLDVLYEIEGGLGYMFSDYTAARVIRGAGTTCEIALGNNTLRCTFVG